jgi:hypothetical protein
MKSLVLASIALFLYATTTLAPAYLASVKAAHAHHVAQIERSINGY